MIEMRQLIALYKAGILSNKYNIPLQYNGIFLDKRKKAVMYGNYKQISL